MLSPNPKTGNWQLADLNDQNGGTVEMNDVQVQTDVGSHETFPIELLVSATNPANVGFSLGLGNFLKFSALGRICPAHADHGLPALVHV